MNFILLSNQQFDFELKTNKWHVANQLVKKGHKVLFVDPPLRFRALKSFIKKPSIDLRRLIFNSESKSANLIIYRPANYFNFWPFSNFNTFLHTTKINDLINGFFTNDKTILYVYHFDYPDLENFVNKVKHDVLVYDCVDDYTEFPEYRDLKFVNPLPIMFLQKIDNFLKVKLNQHGLQGKEWVWYREKWLVDKADLVIAVSPDIVTKLKKIKEIVHHLPNAAETGDFDLAKSRTITPDDIKNITQPRIGFTGAIDGYKNDLELIEKCAVTYPTYQFVLIGPEKVSDPNTDLTKLKKLPNVHFLGQKPSTQMPAYFNSFDEYFIPYDPKTYTGFPIKYFESLAAGLPTIVTDLSAYQGFDVDGYVSKNTSEFVANIKKGLDQNSPERIKKRKELAYQNTWDGKTDKILKLINEK